MLSYFSLLIFSTLSLVPREPLELDRAFEESLVYAFEFSHAKTAEEARAQKGEPLGPAKALWFWDHGKEHFLLADLHLSIFGAAPRPTDGAILLYAATPYYNNNIPSLFIWEPGSGLKSVIELAAPHEEAPPLDILIQNPDETVKVAVSNIHEANEKRFIGADGTFVGGRDERLRKNKIHSQMLLGEALAIGWADAGESVFLIDFKNIYEFNLKTGKAQVVDVNAAIGVPGAGDDEGRFAWLLCMNDRYLAKPYFSTPDSFWKYDNGSFTKIWDHKNLEGKGAFGKDGVVEQDSGKKGWGRLLGRNSSLEPIPFYLPLPFGEKFLWKHVVLDGSGHPILFNNSGKVLPAPERPLLAMIHNRKNLVKIFNYESGEEVAEFKHKKSDPFLFAAPTDNLVVFGAYNFNRGNYAFHEYSLPSGAPRKLVSVVSYSIGPYQGSVVSRDEELKRVSWVFKEKFPKGGFWLWVQEGEIVYSTCRNVNSYGVVRESSVPGKRRYVPVATWFSWWHELE